MLYKTAWMSNVNSSAMSNGNNSSGVTGHLRLCSFTSLGKPMKTKAKVNDGLWCIRGPSPSQRSQLARKIVQESQHRCAADQALQEVEIALRYVKIVVMMVRHLTAEFSIKLQNTISRSDQERQQTCVVYQLVQILAISNTISNTHTSVSDFAPLILWCFKRSCPQSWNLRKEEKFLPQRRAKVVTPAKEWHGWQILADKKIIYSYYSTCVSILLFW